MYYQIIYLFPYIILTRFRPYDARKPSKTEFDSGLKNQPLSTSSPQVTPIATSAPSRIPPSEPIFTTATSTPDSSLPPTEIRYSENLETEFHSMNFLTNDEPVDVDEALQNENQTQWDTVEENVMMILILQRAMAICY